MKYKKKCIWDNEKRGGGDISTIDQTEIKNLSCRLKMKKISENFMQL